MKWTLSLDFAGAIISFFHAIYNNMYEITIDEDGIPG